MKKSKLTLIIALVLVFLFFLAFQITMHSYME